MGWLDDILGGFKSPDLPTDEITQALPDILQGIGAPQLSQEDTPIAPTSAPQPTGPSTMAKFADMLGIHSSALQGSNELHDQQRAADALKAQQDAMNASNAGMAADYDKNQASQNILSNIGKSGVLGGGIRGAAQQASSSISPALLASLGLGGQLLGGVGGYAMGNSDRKAASQTFQDAANAAGYTQDLGPSQAASVTDDASTLAMRNNALQGLQERASMGLTPEDQASLNNIRNQTNGQFQARQATIQNDMGRRGMGNSGLALAQQMENNQAQTQQQSTQADNTATMNFQAKQQALQNLNSGANTALTNDFNRDIERAKSSDAVSKFNTQNRIDAQTRKAGAMNTIANNQNAQAANKANLGSSIGNTIGAAAGALVNKQNNQK